MSYTKNGSGTEIIEENNYYPFGLKHQGYNQTQGNPSYKYQYNGKEVQEETGWNDFGARMYMSDIGRWGVIDPLAESTRRFSPYNYALNNPVMFIDPDGRKAQYMGAENELFGVENAGIIGRLNQMSYNRFGSFTSFLGDDMPFNTGANSGTGAGAGIDEVTITGSLAQMYVALLQRAAGNSITLIYDQKSGKLTYQKNTKDQLIGKAQIIVNSIDKLDVFINILANDTFKTTLRDVFVAGAFMGNNYDSSTNTVNAFQEVNPIVLSKMSAANNKIEDDAVHELDEALQGGLLALQNKVSIPAGSGPDYDYAHGKAFPQSGGVDQYFIDGNSGLILQYYIPGVHNPVETFYKTNGVTILTVK